MLNIFNNKLKHKIGSQTGKLLRHMVSFNSKGKALPEKPNKIIFMKEGINTLINVTP